MNELAITAMPTELRRLMAAFARMAGAAMTRADCLRFSTRLVFFALSVRAMRQHEVCRVGPG